MISSSLSAVWTNCGKLELPGEAEWQQNVVADFLNVSSTANQSTSVMVCDFSLSTRNTGRVSACDVLATLESPVSGTVRHALWKSGALSGPLRKYCAQKFVKGLPVEP